MPIKRRIIPIEFSSLRASPDEEEETEKYLKRIEEIKKNKKVSRTLSSIDITTGKDLQGNDVNTTEKAFIEKNKEKALSFLEGILGSSASDPTVAGAVSSAVDKSVGTNPKFYGDPSSPPATRAVYNTNSDQSSATRVIKKAPKKEKSVVTERFQSSLAGIVGLFAGGVAVTPITALHDILLPGETITNGVAQWEYDTDTGSIAAALFAIVYRYSVREGEEKNTLLPIGVIAAFVIVRAVSRVRVSYYCDSVPLYCGNPIGYFDWDMLGQMLFSGLEGAVLFGATAAAIEFCYDKGYISRIDS